MLLGELSTLLGNYYVWYKLFKLFPASQDITKIKKISDIGRAYMSSKLDFEESKI